MKKTVINSVKFLFPSLSANENTARGMVNTFIAQMNPTLEELADIKCAVSEAVTNCIVHGYRDTCGVVQITVKLFGDRSVKIEVRDKGVGIEDISAALQPLYTSDPEGERSGMGFTLMESFMDKLTVTSKKGRGTKVTLEKKLAPLPQVYIS